MTVRMVLFHPGVLGIESVSSGRRVGYKIRKENEVRRGMLLGEEEAGVEWGVDLIKSHLDILKIVTK